MRAIFAVQATHGAGRARQRRERAARIFAHGVRLGGRSSASGARRATGFALLFLGRAISRRVRPNRWRWLGECQPIEVRLGLVQRALGRFESAELRVVFSSRPGLGLIEPLRCGGSGRGTRRAVLLGHPFFGWRCRCAGRRRAELGRTLCARREARQNPNPNHQTCDFHRHFLSRAAHRAGAHWLRRISFRKGSCSWGGHDVGEPARVIRGALGRLIVLRVVVVALVPEHLSLCKAGF